MYMEKIKIYIYWSKRGRIEEDESTHVTALKAVNHIDIIIAPFIVFSQIKTCVCVYVCRRELKYHVRMSIIVMERCYKYPKVR